MQKTVEDPQALSINKVMDIPVAQQRQLPMDTVVDTPDAVQHQMPMVQRAQMTDDAPEFQFINESVRIPVVTQRQIPTIEKLWKNCGHSPDQHHQTGSTHQERERMSVSG